MMTETSPIERATIDGDGAAECGAASPAAARQRWKLMVERRLALISVEESLRRMEGLRPMISQAVFDSILDRTSSVLAFLRTLDIDNVASDRDVMDCLEQMAILQRRLAELRVALASAGQPKL